MIGGTFVQTSTCTLALRVAPGSNDTLQVTGAAKYGFRPKVTDQLTPVIAGGGLLS